MRHRFGGGIPEWVVSAGDPSGDGFVAVLETGVEVTFWNSRTGGTQHTDLQDSTGAEISSVTSDGEGGLPEFDGPDAVVLMYADAGGTRRIILANDLGGEVLDLRADHDALAASTANAPRVLYRNTDGTWPSRPSTGAPVQWWDNDPTDPQPPSIGGDGMTDDLDYYVGRV